MAKVMFSGHLRFMKSNMAVFQRDGVEIERINDEENDAYGSKLREVYVECERGIAQQIGDALEKVDENNKETKYGGWIKV